MSVDPTSSPKTRKPSSQLWLARIFALFFFLGCAGLIPVIRQANRDYRVANIYLQSEADIIEAIPINSGYRTRPGQRREPSTRPSFVFRFVTKEGETVTTRGYDAYGGREAPHAEWNLISTGDRVPCWYDPSHPKSAVLSRRFNPHFYWLTALPLGIMIFTGLLLRETLRRAVPARLKDVQKGRRLAWRLPTTASQRAMTGCLGVAAMICALLALAFTLAALDYQVPVYRYRWISHLLGFNMNGWWIVAFVTALVAVLFLWAFLVNLRWIFVPEPEVEVNATRLLPGQSTALYLKQAGPLKAESYKILLICEINGTPGKPPAIQKTIIEKTNLSAGSDREAEAVEFSAEIAIPDSARSTCHSVPMKATGMNAPRDLVAWFIRVERKVSPKNTLQSDFEILVGPGDA
ncbi:MAG: DUF3592 domain-containing protein [Verrucomicrobiales bacterium]